MPKYGITSYLPITYTQAPGFTAETFNPPASSRMSDTSNALVTPHTADTMSTSYIPPFERTWVDETEHFNMVDVYNGLQTQYADAKEFDPRYGWYNDAVSIGAIFPPGIPMSAKEVMAYYPHHIRWKGMMLRLTDNDYRGIDFIGMQAFFRGPADHHISAGKMNLYQRDAAKVVYPEFKLNSYKGRLDPDLSMTHIEPGKSVVDRIGTFTIPLYDDLLRGLRHFPSGLDARVLTECLAWYKSVRDTFNPPLQFNVLHTQALSRVLQVPLKPYGPQNLDYLSLMEWREKGEFKTRPMDENITTSTSVQDMDSGNKKRSHLNINMDTEEVTMEYKIRLQHIFTFPFVAMQDLIGEAFTMGIKKAEERATARGVVLTPTTTTTNDQSLALPLTTANLRALLSPVREPTPAPVANAEPPTAPQPQPRVVSHVVVV
ncbi:hypothetical protein Alg130_06832 [Pyrenophora tritici-repentis]|nr:hypothetical protein Alg130_06832 [Pyrenophora tritici-repentis]KAI1536433.1 hypothetical protein PtrSN001C_006524 [Pyrenophora tritici-repentis]PZD27061.1 hypothetical protein A1F96_07056 [Pyrenophora tritici-repentis]